MSSSNNVELFENALKHIMAETLITLKEAEEMINGDQEGTESFLRNYMTNIGRLAFALVDLSIQSDIVPSDRVHSFLRVVSAVFMAEKYRCLRNGGIGSNYIEAEKAYDKEAINGIIPQLMESLDAVEHWQKNEQEGA